MNSRGVSSVIIYYRLLLTAREQNLFAVVFEGHGTAAARRLSKTFPFDGDRLQLAEQLINSDHRVAACTRQRSSTATAVAVLVARVGEQRVIRAVGQRSVRMKESSEVQRIRGAQRLKCL